MASVKVNSGPPFRAAYEIEEQLIRDDTEPKNRVLWRPAGAVSPPLYPAGLAELMAGA